MRTKKNTKDTGNALICVLGTILILSLIGANVLQSSANRLNSSTIQVRAWKEALSAAETAGDIAFAEIRKETDPNQWSTTSWNNSGYVDANLCPKGASHSLASAVTFGNDNLEARAIVEACYFDTATKRLTLIDATHTAAPKAWYRIRSKGTAPLLGLKRTGMDDAIINDTSSHFAAFGSTTMQDITARGKGDSLLRKIDFYVDHFVTTYGASAEVPPTGSTFPSISRRVEQIVSPVTPFFDAAIKTAGSFYGLGAASFIDSYNSNNGPYDITVKDNSSSPYYGDSRHGNVESNSATVTVKGSIYGDVGTNGGNVTSGNPGIVYGIIDNNVPFTLDNFPMPLMPAPQPSPISVTASDQTISPSPSPGGPGPGTSTAPVVYLISSITKTLTLNPTLVSGNPVDTYIAIRVPGDISSNSAGITVNPKVHVKIYFMGNIDIKAQNIVNTSPNTPSTPGLGGPYCGNLQFYGRSDGVAQSVTMTSGGGQPQVFATFYAPSAIVQFNGAPDFYGTVIGNTFYANGNITWHYDRALNDDGNPLGFKISSYVEDTR